LTSLPEMPYPDVYTDIDMDLTKKATILFSPSLYQHLADEAELRNSSVGELVREACRLQYLQKPSREKRLSAVAAMAKLRLPVGTPQQMKNESVDKVDRVV
jgi:hypothetical protein